jgi:hypothetical protein
MPLFCAAFLIAYLGSLGDSFTWFSPGATLTEFPGNPMSTEYSDTQTLWSQLWIRPHLGNPRSVVSSSILFLFGEGDRHATGDFEYLAKLAARTLDGQPGHVKTVFGKTTNLSETKSGGRTSSLTFGRCMTTMSLLFGNHPFTDMRRLREEWQRSK